MTAKEDFSQVTTVVFDLDDTLRHNDPHPHHFFCDYAETLTRPLTREQRLAVQRWEHTYWASSADLLNDQASLSQETEAFWLNYSKRRLRALGLGEDEVERLHKPVHAHMRENFRPVGKIKPGVPEALATLRASGYMLGVITNRFNSIHAEMHQLGLDLYFDFYLTGGQLGAYKPDKAIFNKLLSFIGRPAHEIMYIGDNYYADIVGARNAGMHPVLVNEAGIYEDVDCVTILSVTEVPALLQLQPTP